MSRLISYPLMAPEDTGNGSGSPVAGSTEADTNVKDFLLNDDDDESLDLPEKTVKGKTEEENIEETDETDPEEDDSLEDEIESELTIDEEKLDLIEPVRRADILKKFPKIFDKKEGFPYLEHAYYRDQKYTEIFSTPREAEEASEKAQALDNFEQVLYSGDIAKVLGSVKQDDPNAFTKIVDNLMVAVGQVDETAQTHIIRNIGIHLRDLMLQESADSGNEALKHAAVLLNQFISGSSKPAEFSKLSKDEPKRDESLDRERQEFLQERHNVVRDGVVTRLHGKITATLKAKLDPNESMTEFVRDAALNKAQRLVQQNIAADTRFQTVMKQAWTRAVKGNYRKEDVELIRKSYENKAAQLLPSIITKVRSEALRGLGKRNNSSESDENVTIRQPEKRGPVAAGRSTTPNSSGKQDARSQAKAAQAKGMTAKQFLMQD